MLNLHLVSKRPNAYSLAVSSSRPSFLHMMRVLIIRKHDSPALYTASFSFFLANHEMTDNPGSAQTHALGSRTLTHGF